MQTPADSCDIIGMDLGGTKLSAARFSPDLEMQERSRVEVHDLTADEVIEALVSAIQGLTTGSERGVGAVCAGIPSTIDRRTGMAVVAANLPIANVPIERTLTDATGIPSFADNDGTLAGLGEQRAGAAAGCDTIIALTLGTGVGGGIVIDGKPFSGAIGGGSEIGHMTIDWDGPPCSAPNCSGRGCYEAFCSGTALRIQLEAFIAEHPGSSLARQVADGAPPRGELVVEAADAGDDDAVALLTRLGERLGDGMTTLTNIFNPEVIVVGGGLGAAAATYLLPTAQARVRAQALPPARDFVDVRAAKLGADAGVIGAAVYAQQRLAAMATA